MITQSEVGPLAVRWDTLAVGSAMTWVAAAYLVLLAGVVAFVGASSPPAQFDPAFAADPHRFTLYRLGFVCASLLAPAILTLLALLVLTRGGVGARDMVGVLILVTYPSLSSLAYASQWTLLPRLITTASWARPMCSRGIYESRWRNTCPGRSMSATGSVSTLSEG
jgi:hypothetical protein